jgi:hypothetical protein
MPIRTWFAQMCTFWVPASRRHGGSLAYCLGSGRAGGTCGRFSEVRSGRRVLRSVRSSGLRVFARPMHGVGRWRGGRGWRTLPSEVPGMRRAVCRDADKLRGQGERTCPGSAPSRSQQAGDPDGPGWLRQERGCPSSWGRLWRHRRILLLLHQQTISNSCAPAHALVHCVMPGQGHPAVLPGSASLIAAGLGGLGHAWRSRANTHRASRPRKHMVRLLRPTPATRSPHRSARSRFR